MSVNSFQLQDESAAFMKENGVQAQAWAPFAESDNELLENPVLATKLSS